MSRAREIADLIGGTTPDIILKTADGAILNLQTSDTTVTDGSVLGAINFTAPNEASGTDSITIGGAILAVAEGTFAADNNATELVFMTGASEAATSKMVLSSAGALAVTGVVTANAGVVVDNFTLDGTTLALSSGDLTIDAAGDIILDAAGADIRLTLAGTAYGKINLASNNVSIQNLISDGDILFKGNDGGSGITALTLDMSSAGTAIFGGEAIFADSKNIYFGAGSDLQLKSDGTNGVVTAPNGNLTFDVAADITLDFTDELNLFKGGVQRGVITAGDAFVTFGSSNNNGDVKIMGIDGGSGITALTFDMSEAGTALFNSKIVTGLGSGYATDADITLGSTGPGIFFHDTSSGDDNAAITVNNGNIVFKNGGTGTNVSNLTERVRIASTGRTYLITGGNEPSNSQTGLRISGIDGDNFWKSANSGTSAYDQLAFFNGNGLVGKIQTSSSATSYITSSDYRLKENVNYDWDATTRLKQLKPARFNFIADADTTVDGFLAHEAQAVVPESVSGTKDAVEVWKNGEELPDGVSVGDNKLDADGNTTPDMQGIDQAKLVPLLVKTLQEALAEIDTLKTKVQALEDA